MLSKNKRFRGTHLGNRPVNAAMAGSPERKRSLKLALFVGLPESPAVLPSPTAAKSPRSFDDGGAVGLGIVAAMIGGVAAEGRPPPPPPSRLAAPARSEPIPIVSPRSAGRTRRAASPEEEKWEMSESYTCVISHVGGKPVRKRVYFDDGSDDIDGNSGVFFQSPPAPAELAPPPAVAEDFLSCCYLCRKKLHGLDIFMYRGEKAFCSVECRCQQIVSDELRGKCGSRSRKNPYEYSLSPCSTPLFFAAGVAAA